MAKGPDKVPTPPHPRLPFAEAMRPTTFRPPVAAGPRIKPTQTRDYAKSSPVSIKGVTDGLQS